MGDVLFRPSWLTAVALTFFGACKLHSIPAVSRGPSK
jgi:hypothetical protein